LLVLKIKKEDERLIKEEEKKTGFPFPDQVEDRFHGNDRRKGIEVHPHPNPLPSRERGR